MSAVAPGFIDIEIIHRARMGTDSSPELLRQIPACRLGNPDKVATTILFLAIPEAPYIVGQAIVIDGGYLLR